MGEKSAENNGMQRVIVTRHAASASLIMLGVCSNRILCRFQVSRHTRVTANVGVKYDGIVYTLLDYTTSQPGDLVSAVGYCRHNVMHNNMAFYTILPLTR